MIRARYALVHARTALVCSARGLTKSFGERICGRNPKAFRPEMGETLSPQLQAALAPLLSALEAITAQIREYDAQIEKLAEESYPDVTLLKQVKGVGTLIALTYILTLEVESKTERKGPSSRWPASWQSVDGQRRVTPIGDKEIVLYSADGGTVEWTLPSQWAGAGVSATPVDWVRAALYRWLRR